MIDNPYAEILCSSVKVFNLDRGSSTRYLRLNCPWCGDKFGKEDTDGHLNFYLDNSVSRCMRCSAWGNVQRLFTTLGLRLPLDLGFAFNIPGLVKTRLNELLAPVRPVALNRPTRVFEEPPEIELPPSSLPLQQLCNKLAIHRRVLNRIAEWRLDPAVVFDLRWHWCVPLDSFIFPVFSHTRPVSYPIYWASRSFDGKFHSSAECEFSQYGILGNFDHPLQYSGGNVLYLVEGPKDAAALIQEGFWAVHLFGHSPNATQIDRLNVLPHTKVLLLDADVTDQAAELAVQHSWEVLYLPKGDPADYAGSFTSLLAELWQNQTPEVSPLGTLRARLHQKLRTPQVHQNPKKNLYSGTT